MVCFVWTGLFNQRFKYLSRLITLFGSSESCFPKQCKRKVQSIPKPLDAAQRADKNKGTAGHLVWYETLWAESVTRREGSRGSTGAVSRDFTHCKTDSSQTRCTLDLWNTSLIIVMEIVSLSMETASEKATKWTFSYVFGQI